jgi:hypothetical protein
MVDIVTTHRSSPVTAVTMRVYKELEQLLCDLEEYFDGRADADCDQDGFIPNEAMKFLTRIREILPQSGLLVTGVAQSMPSEPVAWRYKCQDGSEVLMLKRLTDEQKRRGYYTGEDGEDEVEGDEAIVGPFHWAEETPLYASPLSSTPSEPAQQPMSEPMREAQDSVTVERIADIIGWYTAATVSGNNQPHMSGDPRNRLHGSRRRHFDDACKAAAEAIRAALDSPLSSTQGNAVEKTDGSQS